ncbi:MAG TPA: chromosome segregation protein SMC, partial [Anaeromyxobacteraceae bacterium]|nr:chromosome segregation protein SMC [Anaeromyxobacteraceae bacterium]
ASRYLELSAQRRAAEERLAQARAEEAEVSARLAELEAQADRDRAGRDEGERQLQDLGAREHDLASRSRVAAVSAESAERELAETGERARSQAAEVEALKAQEEALAREGEGLLRQRHDLETLGGSDEARLSETSAALSELGAAEAGLLAEAEAARGGASEALSRAAERRTGLQEVERRRGEAAARLDRVRRELDDLSARSAALDGTRSAQVEKLGRTRQLRLHLEAERGAQEEILERTRSEFIQNEARLIQVREELSDRRARLESLREVLRNYEGHGRGVRSLMTRAGQGDPAGERGIFGLVADVVSAPPEYETAVEAVLGERLQYVIVESHARGVEAIDWLKSAAEGRASLIPLERLRGGEASPDPDRGHPGFVATCLEVVRHDPAYERVVRFLLGDAVIVRDLRSALDLWQSDPVRRTLVTLDGEVLDPWGVVTGGPLEGEGHGALQRRREVQELEQTVRGFEAQFALAQDRHRTLQSRTAQLEAALRNLDKDGREKDQLLLDQEKDLARLGADLETVGARAAGLERERAELEEARESLSREEEAHRLEAAAAEAEQARQEERAREAGARLAELRRRGEGLQAELLNLKVKVAAEGERREAIGGALDRLEASRAEVVERRQRLYGSLSASNGRAAELGERLSALSAERAQLEAELGRAREALAAARAAHEALLSAGGAREAQARELRRRAEAL